MGGRLGDDVAARRRERFVGRVAEQDLFSAILANPLSGVAVVNVVGIGGVGKSALLRVWSRAAEAAGKAVRMVDGHDVDPNPSAFRAAAGAIGIDPVVLVVDTYELLQPLDDWLREEFVAALPAGSLVVLGGRDLLSANWRADPGWRDLVRVVRLEPLTSEESVAYLADAGVPSTARATVAAATRGHPLAIGLAVDVLRQSDVDPGPDLVRVLASPEIVTALAARFVADVPGPAHLAALTAAVITRFTSEESLRAATGVDDARPLFEWLRGLSCIDVAPRGLYPHDLARDVLDADLKWRDEQGYQQIWHGSRAEILRRIATLRGDRQREAIFDLFFTIRADPPARPIWRWATLGAVVPEPVTPADRPAILALVEHHEGAESAVHAAHWLDRQPAGFRLYRVRGEVAGFCAYLSLTTADTAAVAADPVTAAVWRHVTGRDVPTGDDEVLVNRFRIDRDAYQQPSHAQDLVSVLHFQHVTTHPSLRWDVQVLADVGPYLALARIGFHPVSEPGPVVDGRAYGLLVRDATEPHPMWDAIRPPRPPLQLPTEDLTAAVRIALRHLHRPDMLATNPLCRTKAVLDLGGDAAALRTVILTAADQLRAHPRDAKLHRALDRTYLRPAANQEAAAEMLGLPMTTYRRHLTQAIGRLAEAIGTG
jgi:hypothetical protein